MSRNDNLNQFDDLIDELKQAGERPSLPPTFKTELRGQLLDQYEQPRFSWGNVRQWAGTAVAFAVLALVVYFSWFSLSQQPAAISAQMGTVDVPGRDEFIVYDQLRLEFPMWVELDSGWAAMTAESWQSLDGTFFRGEVVDANGKQRIFVQGDGQFLWQGTYDSSVERMETVSLQYFDVYHALAQAEGWTGNFTTPPFYDDVGWDGLVQSVLRLDWNCDRAECVSKYLAEPPLGVNSRGGEYEPYGWGVDLVGTETTANGRSLTTYRIGYSPNQDGNTSSQYRLVKLDSNNNTVVEVADYDGDTLLRRLERVSHQLMTSADLPEDQFTQLPAGMGVSFRLPQGKIIAETPLLVEPNGEPLATLEIGTRLELSGLMNNKQAIVQDGITWQYVTVLNVGQGWVDEAYLHWPITQYGNLINMDTSQLPTAVPVQTQLTILQTYQAELEALRSQTNGERLAQLEQALDQIAAEITRLEQQQIEADLSSFRGGPLLNRHELSAVQLIPGDTLDVTLFWDGRPETATNVALHLTDESGSLLSQADQPLTTEMTLSLPIPQSLTEGVYELVAVQYDAATGIRQDSFLLQEIGVETAVSSPTQHATNDVWLISATQQARTSTGDPVTLEITVGYQFESDEQVILNPLYVNPNWGSVSDGTLPIDGLGKAITLTEQTSTQTITFTEQPGYMRQRTGTDQPVLVMQMGYVIEHEDGRRELKILALRTITDFAIDLTSTEEITYQIDMSDFETVSGAVVSGTDNNGLTLRSEPNGQDIGILEEGSVVLLNDDTLMESDGLLWQSVSTTIGKGWVVADFLEYPEGYTPAETMPWSPDSLWIAKATQLSRSGLDEAITLEVTVGYKLVTADEAILSLSFIHPEWETDTSLDEIRYPNYNALGGQYPIQTGTGSVIITATVEPETITSAIGSDKFGLMPRLWATDENGRIIFGPIFMGFNRAMSFNAQSLEELTYPTDLSEPATEEGPIVLESVVQQKRHTAVVTFQVIVEEPIPNASLQLFLVNPNWDFDRTNIQSFQRFLPRTGEEGFFVTATPEQIREATGTDHPIVATILEPFDSTNGTNIMQKFLEFPFDLTSREEIRFEP